MGKEYYNRYKGFNIEGKQTTVPYVTLPSKGTDKKQLDEQFLSLSEEEKIIAIDLFESLKIVMEKIIKEKNTHH